MTSDEQWSETDLSYFDDHTRLTRQRITSTYIQRDVTESFYVNTSQNSAEWESYFKRKCSVGIHNQAITSP